ncbi:MAG TPA: FAD:protein FMN transferase, partial [Verrucomicrobiae bacterium]|nr:FAD:protein FMN transferase [Verrucomicrobiae bacterium]
GGIAKGYIVDRAIAWLQARAPETKALINAGGDLRFLNWPAPRAHLRLGTSEAPVWREIALCQPGLATSAPQTFTDPATSRTSYRAPLRWPVGFSVAVQAPTVAVADALTKVALFGARTVAQSCAEALNALMLVFDQNGELVESFG